MLLVRVVEVYRVMLSLHRILLMIILWLMVVTMTDKMVLVITPLCLARR